MKNNAIEQDEFRKWLELMSSTARYSDLREMLRVVLKHYDDTPKPKDEGGLKECKDCVDVNDGKHKLVTQNVINLQNLHNKKQQTYSKAEGKPANSDEYKSFAEASDNYNEAVRKDPFAAYLIGLIEYKKKHDGPYVILTEVLKVYEQTNPAHTDRQEALAVLADRKGYGVHVYRYDQMGDIYLSLSKGHRNNWVERWNAPTYAACEQMARTWLEEQEEKK